MAIEDKDPHFGIEMEPAAKVFLELAACFRSDDVLKARIATWVIPGRSQWLLDKIPEFSRLIAPGAIPHVNECPLLKMVPEPRDGQPFDNVSQEATLTARVEIWLPADDPISLLNFWGRLQKAVLGTTLAENRQIRVRLHDAGAKTGEVLIEQPVLGAARDLKGEPIVGLVGAEGSLSVTYLISEGG